MKNFIWIPIKVFIFSLFIVLAFSCNSTPNSKKTVQTASKSAEKHEEQLIKIEEKADTEIEAEEPIEEYLVHETAEEELDEELYDTFIEELIAEITEVIEEITDESAAIEEIAEEEVIQISEPPKVTAVPSQPQEMVAVPLQPVPLPTPAPFSQSTPPAVPPGVQENIQAPEPAEEITEEPAEETAPARPDRSNVPEPQPNLTSREKSGEGSPLDYPATKLDSLAQMGLTPLDSEIIYSRIVHATVGQTVEIPFRGNGWVYLGETALRRGIVYNSRRSESNGQTFIFSLEEAGVYTLKFYRQDFIKDFILNDHVQVIVSDAQIESQNALLFNPPADRGKVVVQPRWPSPLEEAQIRSGARLPSEPVVTAEIAPTSPAKTAPATQPPSTLPQSAQLPESSPAPTRESTPPEPQPSTRTVGSLGEGTPPEPQPSTRTAGSLGEGTPPEPQPSTRTAGSLSEGTPPDVLIKRAQDYFEGGDITQSIALLNQYIVENPGGSDEVYWLLGQYYEANSPSRNIKLSIDYYKRLVNEYPQSSRFNDARRRIAYLERYYINIQ